MREAYRLLIGSIGDDIHSVGMALLTLAFRESGFRVKNLGIGNSLDDFFHQASDYDAIFISCLNGHADLYLDDFPAKLGRFRLADSAPRAWYLGGNLSVKEPEETVVRRYLGMGFDYVSCKPVTWEVILERLERDFFNKGIKKQEVGFREDDAMPAIPNLELINDDQLTDEEFNRIRKEVLAEWPTGAQVWTADIKKNHSQPQKNLHSVIVNRQAAEYRPLLQPRTGVAHISDEIAILTYLRKNGLDVSSIQLDAASRKKMYKKAEEGVVRTEKGAMSFLNGFPIPVHGVDGVAEILDAIETPFQIRAGSADHRLVYEIGLAGGTSSVEGGFICYLYPYEKQTSPATSLRYWKYVDKLTEYYNRRHGIIINREYFGPLTTSLIEPSTAICVNIIQALLSAKSGVLCISVGLAEQGCRSQDIAAIRALDALTRQYLAKYGFALCTVSTVYHQYMAAFPTDIAKARELILNSSTTGALAKATRFMTKTPVESIHIPAKEDNAESLHLTQKGVSMARETNYDRQAVQREMRLIERQVNAMMHSIELLGRGSIARGAIRAFQEGLLDIPFSPSQYNKNASITARDCDGAIRFVNPERLPFDSDIHDFHKERIHLRMVAERIPKVSAIIERDLTRIWKNDFRKWPLDGTYVS